MWRNLAIETTGRYYSYYKYTCKSMYGIQESRLRACIYGSHMHTRIYIQNFQDRETLMAEKEVLIWQF